MRVETENRAFGDSAATTSRLKDGERTCEELREAIDGGKIGDIVAKHEKLILHYYADVQTQANQSFQSAKNVAVVGFLVLTLTLIYALIFDALTRLELAKPFIDKSAPIESFMVAKVGIVSGALIEFIAAINFWLYARGSKQFSAFHICLERTHRYLLAYKISEELHEDRDKTLRDLVCIMANAPMITRGDINATGTLRAKRGATPPSVSADAEPLQATG